MGGILFLFLLPFLALALAVAGCVYFLRRLFTGNRSEQLLSGVLLIACGLAVCYLLKLTTPLFEAPPEEHTARVTTH
jgi:hypothetical protein